MGTGNKAEIEWVIPGYSDWWPFKGPGGDTHNVIYERATMKHEKHGKGGKEKHMMDDMPPKKMPMKKKGMDKKGCK